MRALGAVLSVTVLIGCAFGVLEMWPVQNEVYYKCEMHTGFRRLKMKEKREYVMNTSQANDYMSK